MANRFPYDEASLDAMIELVNQNYPGWRIERAVADFNDIFFSPTPSRPGRTFVQLKMPRWQYERNFIYDRLDLNIALGGPVSLKMRGTITPRRIAEQLNETFNMTFGPNDISYDGTDLNPMGRFPLAVTVKALSHSLVWYGEVRVTIEQATQGRLLEDGRPRLLENGNQRQLEATA